MKALPLVPSSYFANDVHSAELEVGKSKVPVPSTGLPGRNFKLLGFGVSSVKTESHRTVKQYMSLI